MIFFKLPIVSRLKGRKRESSVKTLCSPVSDEIRRNCVLNDGSQRGDLPHYQSEEMELQIISLPGVGIESKTCHAYRRTLVPLRL